MAQVQSLQSLVFRLFVNVKLSSEVQADTVYVSAGQRRIEPQLRFTSSYTRPTLCIGECVVLSQHVADALTVR